MADGFNLRLAKPGPAGGAGPVVFSVWRNEHYFLPFFFDHYRALGAVSFLIYDDRSDERAREVLYAQPDCAILTSDFNFGDTFGLDAFGQPRRLPVALKESAPEALLPGRWVLTADADEFFVPPPGFSSLPDLIARAEQAGRSYVTAPMVDFYGEILEGRNYDAAIDPFTANPYFDAGPYYHWTGEHGPRPAGGGLRERLLKMLHEERPDALRAVFGERAPHFAKCWKVPLLKHGAGVRRIADHEISVAPRGDLAGTIAHFKFTPGLDAKIASALKERQYYGGSIEYAFLAAAIAQFGARSLIASETRRFEGPASLAAAGLAAAEADLAPPWPAP